MEYLIASAFVFVLSHILLSGTALRGWVVELIGEGPFRGIYSLIALAALIWMVRAYNAAPFQELWDVRALELAPLVLMPFALILLVTGMTGSNPALAGPQPGPEVLNQPRGILRVTRHPMMMGIALWALAHLLARGDTASVWFFGALLALSAVGPVSQDFKKAAQWGERWRTFASATSIIPFVAIAAGRNRLVAREFSLGRIALALGIYVILVMAHEPVFGVAAY